MGFSRWLKKKGSTGSIARWVADNFMKLVANGMPGEEALKFLVATRYMHPGANLTPGESGVLAEKLRGDPPTTPSELARFVWDVEIGSQLPANGLEQETRECYTIMDEELAARGIRPQRATRAVAPSTPAPEVAWPRVSDAVAKCLNLAMNDISRMAKQLWRESLSLRLNTDQALHALFVSCTAMAAADFDPGFSVMSIQSLASRFGDLDFYKFIASPEASEPLLALVRDSRASAHAGDVEKQTELIMTFLIVPAGAPSQLSPSGQTAVLEAAGSILSRTVACRGMMRIAGGLE